MKRRHALAWSATTCSMVRSAIAAKRGLVSR
jgi:hypothetical protein